jgi:UDP-glucose 4-epimerase
LESPSTGIVDSHALMQSLFADFESAGGVVRYRIARSDRIGCHRRRGRVPSRSQLTASSEDIMDIKGKKLVLVGGAGLIGSHTTDLLLKEDVREIVIYDNFVRGRVENLTEALKDPRVKIFDIGGDVMQSDILEVALDSADGVFHLAALWLLQCHDFPRSAFDVNIRGTFNVMEACVKKGVKRLVYSSSASVYGDAVQEPMTEEHPFNNKNFYGATKIAGEAMLRSFHHCHGLNYVGLRYMNVYGPRQDYHGAYIAVIMKMLDAIEKGDGPTIMGDGSEAFDFVAVEDCGAANVCAMKADTSDRFYNVGTGKHTSLKELAELILKITGCTRPINYAPRSQATLVRNRIGCPKRARTEIGFDAKLDLATGLKRLIEWRKTHKAEVEARRRAVGLPA